MGFGGVRQVAAWPPCYSREKSDCPRSLTMSDLLRQPIIFVGTQRSGTTWMGDVFARHPDLAYWSEPRHVWTAGNAYRPDDVLTERDARSSVVRRVHRTFDRFVRSAGKARLCEKTPSNCLRLRFIRAVYPEAKIIVVVRDGRSVIRSTSEIMGRNVPAWRIGQRAVETPVWEWPAYFPRAARTVSRKLLGRGLDFWGPRPPGWRQWVRSDPRDVVLAKQWAATVSQAVDDAQRMDPARTLQFQYEDLMARPREIMQRIVDFAELANADALVEHVARTADPARQNKWRDALDAETLALIRPHMEPTLNRLGYAW